MSLAPARVFAQVQQYCLSKDGAVEEYPWGDVVWKVRGKMFAASGKDSNRVTVKSTPEEQAALIQHPAIEIAAYVGRFGWVTVTVEDEDTLALTRQLIDESHAAVARGKKRTAAHAR